MRKADRDAMRAAIAEARQESPQRADQIAHKLKHESFETVGRFAAFARQLKNLRLRPWQPTPSWIDDPDAVLAKGDDGVMGDYAAALLLKRMLALGISRYHPDPARAIHEAEQAKAS